MQRPLIQAIRDILCLSEATRNGGRRLTTLGLPSKQANAATSPASVAFASSDVLEWLNEDMNEAEVLGEYPSLNRRIFVRYSASHCRAYATFPAGVPNEAPDD